MSVNYTFDIISPMHGTFTVTAPARFRERIDAFTWHVHRNRGYDQNRSFYVATTVKMPREPKRTLRLHRLIWEWSGNPPTPIIDHKDRCPLNNAEDNLRDGKFGNSFNIHLPSTNRTGFLGVSRHSDGTKWTVQVNCAGRQHYVGLFDSLEEAARARDAKARELHGEFASLNFPDVADAGGTP